MRTKYFFIYIGIGVAFAAVSLWVLLSGGKNAKAIRAKYKLGGALLTTWALLSAATCGPRIGGGDPQVLCYDMPAPTNELYVSLKEAGGTKFASGDVMVVSINTATCEKYDWKITDPDRKNVIQSGTFTPPEDQKYSDISFEITVQPGTYKGPALFVLTGYTKWDDGELHSAELTTKNITLQ